LRRPALDRRSVPFVGLVCLVVPALACEELPAAPDTNAPPTASFFFTPVAPIYAGGPPVDFNASASRDEDGTIVSYTWDFGDGTDARTMEVPTIRHTFPDTAATCLEITYGVSLTVTDDKGMSSLTAERVTVIELPAPTSPQCG